MSAKKQPIQQGLISGILLAGGESRRMGRVNKALLRVRGRTIIERSAGILLQLFPEVLVITNSPDDFSFLGLPMHGDIYPGRGSLGGLYTGLTLCTGQWGFLAACDMPFLNGAVIEHLTDLRGEADVIIPRLPGGLEPLHAVYAKECLPYIRDLLASGDLKIIDFLKRVRVREVSEEELYPYDPEFRFIMNVNTPKDLEEAQLIAQEIEP
ncbi:molybdenum cofactor guanylyltransferase [Desulfomonile tiedjei]|uniref:Probable molybdenum cofactor guanylyltransferase n=1 Tax=Desulfomonile tiedjei (strain ATCC 49306 / DSM 6799 / DCB-1) TaxID=706587 RepID=I4CF19_DESTA|nr:molybdenum cofactor guanylyltransferase [Desulfomonile tiedjei]AFM28160.1 molybdopterin-guanine dinucleotide biosynthesis protein A [Desulfomonile tiedjei DSM 6799]